MQEAPPPPTYSPGAPAAARGRLLVDGALVPGAVVFGGGRILEVIRGEAIPAERLPAQVFDAAIVTPGLIDLQVNGGFGFEVGADAEALRALAERLPATGVTAFLPTLVSLARGSVSGGARCVRGRRGAHPRARRRWACTSRARCSRRRAPAPTTAPRSTPRRRS